jgi:membrane protease YdiL (CAAX protease family)
LKSICSHVLILSVLPIIFNTILTPAIVIILVGFKEFITNPTYYVFLYGPYLWSIYDVLFTYLTYVFLKHENEDIKALVGSVQDKLLLTISIIIGLVIISFFLSYVTSLMFDGNNILKKLPLHTSLYLATIGSIIAGICEEFIWRGYLLTRFERLANNSVIAVIIQAILFGLYHGPGIIYTLIFGLITGFIYVKTRKLIPLMMAHWLIDAIGFSLVFFT